LGSLQEAGFAPCLNTGLKRLTAFGFIARSGYNFLVVITYHKGRDSLLVKDFTRIVEISSRLLGDWM